MVTRDHEVTLGVKIQSDLRFSLISLSFYIVDMTMHFSQNIFHLDQFGYKRHAPAFRTQIGLNNFFLFRSILVRKARACFLYPNRFEKYRLKIPAGVFETNTGF